MVKHLYNGHILQPEPDFTVQLNDTTYSVCLQRMFPTALTNV